MNQFFATISKTVAVVGVVAAAGLTSGQAVAQEVVVAPPAEYIATATPVYYEGHAAYYYGNRWYYRDGANWGYYHNEPGYLQNYRGRPEFGVRRYYGGGRRR